MGYRGKVALLCVSVGSLFACAPLAPSSIPSVITNLNDASIILVYGGSPPSANYGVALYPNGLVEFCGVMGVKAVGEQHGQVSTERVEELINRAQSAGFFDLLDEYIGPVTAHGGFELSIAEHPGQLKSVSEIGGALVGMPAIVTDLAAAVDKIADENRWLGSNYNIPAFPECGKKFGFRPPLIVKPIFR